MTFKESNMQSLWTRWIKKNKWDHCAQFELKITHKKNLPFSRVAEHQVYYANKAENGGYHFKPSDQSMQLKPCDSYWFEGRSYIVIMFYEKYKRKVAYVIPIKEWEWYKKQSDRKSITESKAKELAYRKVEL